MTSLRSIAETMHPDGPESVSLRALAGIHQWPGAGPPTPLSVRSFAKRHQGPPGSKMKFIFMNTFLLAAVTLQIRLPPPLPKQQIAIANKPALFPRSFEIGEVIQAEYDIAALCEVFSTAVRENILKAWTSAPTTVADGPSPTPHKLLGGGLLTIGTTARRGRTERQGFKFGGLPLRDLDNYSNKGILLTEIETDFGGHIEIYSTHLLSGRDIPELQIPLPRELNDEFQLRSDEHLNADRLTQVREAAEFIRDHHKPENVAILVGDFNIKDSDPGVPGNAQPYPEMEEILDALGLVDIWKLRRPESAGKTANHVNLKSEICQLPEEEDASYCLEFEDDQPFSEIKGARLDYIFVQRPNRDHKILVDFAFPRRRVFFRDDDVPKLSKIDVLSDHVALDTELIVSPRD